MASAPPTIFSTSRKRARRQRAEHVREHGEPDLFLLDHMAEEVFERMAFVRHWPKAVLLDGFGGHVVAEGPWHDNAAFTWLEDFDVPSTEQSASFDLVASINSLDKVNDLPGALIQMRELLGHEGIAIACFIGGASLPKLRRAMIAAEPDRPAARMHPLVDPRSCPGLLSRAGWRDPVVDSHMLTVRYASLDRLVQDLREQAMGNVLASPAPPLNRAGVERARSAFLAQADDDGKVSETFEIITLTGRR